LLRDHSPQKWVTFTLAKSRNVSLKNLAKLSKAFHITLAELFQFPQGEPEDEENLLRRRVKRLLAEQDEASVRLFFTLQENLQTLEENLQEFRKLILDTERKT
ncbi:hypothetical protein MYX78_13690, partial [Acidobacteria bacterium AH-259-G07]|nr:hypothetical protein [Acidobacteria bacterium AH-259-G07]